MNHIMIQMNAPLTGAIREYLVTKSGIPNPPDLTMTIPVDVRNLNDTAASSSTAESDYLNDGHGVSFVLLTSPLPTNTEGEHFYPYMHTFVPACHYNCSV